MQKRWYVLGVKSNRFRNLRTAAFRPTIGVVVSVVVSITVGIATTTSARAMDRWNPLFTRTHLLPSPYTIPAGTLVYGTTFAIGVTDFFQIGTNVLRDFFQFFNAQGKIAVIDFPDVALGLTVGFEHYKVERTGLPSLDVTSWQPGAVVSFALSDSFATFMGGHFNWRSVDIDRSQVVKSGFLSGSTAFGEFAWSYNPPSKKEGTIGNTLCPGVSYDFTYEMLGIGLSHHWDGFQLGVHYYPSAKENALLPILAGGGTAHF